MYRYSFLFLAAFLLAQFACSPEPPPNIVWIMAEDISLDLACYGMKGVKTPHLDRLAAQGIRYTNAYSTNPICSPNRSGMLLGTHQNTSNTHQHRSNRQIALDPQFKPITHYLRRADYLNVLGHHAVRGKGRKIDVNFRHKALGRWEGEEPFGLFDRYDSIPTNGQPFFAQIQLKVTHRGDWWKEIQAQSDDPVDPAAVELPPYLADHPVIREDWARYLDQMEYMDYEVGLILDELEEKGLADNTVVIFIGDNGRCNIRGKGYLYDPGLHIPLIVRWPNRLPAGKVEDQLVTTTDIAASIVDLAGLPVPESMTGQPFIGTESQRDYVYASRDLWDEVEEESRTLIREDYQYILHRKPEVPFDAGQAYLEFYRPAVHVMRSLSKAGKLTDLQQQFFLPQKPAAEELYDRKKDPHQEHNLALDPAYTKRLEEMREALLDIEKSHQYQGDNPSHWTIPRAPRVLEYVKDAHPKAWERMQAGEEIGFGKYNQLYRATLPSASVEESKPQRPNILFAIMDDASFPHIGANGCDWVHTPHIDRVAREGILFRNAYTPNAKCAPSRAAILTGRNSWQLEEAANHWCYFPQQFTSYAEVLAGNGYHVGYTAKGWAPGVALDAEGKKRQLTGKAYNARKTTAPTSAISSNDYAANFADFLDDRDKTEPFCFWYGSTEPHRRYEYGSGIRKGGKAIEEIGEVFPFWPDNDTVRTDLLDYAYEIEYFDQHLGRMLADLAERGELDNTLVVVTADNGMPFPRIKGQEYELSNHLPLAMRWPGGIKGEGRVVQDMVSFIDFAPTFLELAQVDGVAAGMQAITGRSLVPVLQTAVSGWVDRSRDHILIGKERHDVGRPDDQGYPIRGLVRDGFLYIHNFETDRWPAGDPLTGYLNCDGSPTKTVCLDARDHPETHVYWQWNFGKRPQEELYHIEVDPACMHNLAEEAANEALKSRMKEQLFAALKAQGDPRMEGKGESFDRFEYADQSGVNFYTRYQKGEPLNSGWVNPSDFRE